MCWRWPRTRCFHETNSTVHMWAGDRPCQKYSLLFGGVGVLVGIFILLRDDGRFFCVEIDATCIWMHATTAMKRAAALARLHEDPTVETKLRHFGSASSSGVTGTHRRRAGKRCGPMFCILKCAPGKRKMAFKLQHRHLIKPALPQIWSSDNRLLLLTWICGRETGNTAQPRCKYTFILQNMMLCCRLNYPTVYK